MKLLVTNVDAIVNFKQGVLYDGVVEAFDYFKSMQGNEIIIFTSNNEDAFELIPDRFIKRKVDRKERRVSLISNLLAEYTSFSHSDVLLLGTKDADLHLAANEKVLLLSALYTYKKLEDGLRVFDYGIHIKSIDALNLFFKYFLKIDHPWYYKLNVDDRTTLYSLTNAGTIVQIQGKTLAQMNKKFSDCLKRGEIRNRNLFLIYFLSSAYSADTIEDFKEVDFWGIYPSSSTDINSDLDFFKEKIRILFNGKPRVPNEDKHIFIRTKIVPKRHQLSPDQRIEQGCDDQLPSIIINPYYKGKLKDKIVCIIDDFTRFGSSCEVSRTLLEKAGVKKVIFITMGKFSKDYYKYDYNIEGDIYSNYTFHKEHRTYLNGGDYNMNAGKIFQESLNDLL